MPRYPHTKLYHDFCRTVVISGPHIQVLDPDGRVLNSTATLPPVAVVKSGPIRCSGMSHDGRHLATAGDDKQLKVWDLDSLTLLSARALPKKPTSICFTKNGDVLVSDKFGDVFRYALEPNNDRADEKCTGDALASHENPSGGELVLGHASLLTSCLLTPDERFVITTDRDEHIRVSWYPEGYVIESYCLGHKKYVSAVHIPVVSPTSLISGGGDIELKVWDWMTGRLERNVVVFPTVERFIRVRPHIRRHRSSGEQDDDDDDDEAGTWSGKKRTTRKARRDDPSAEPEDVNLDEPTQLSSETSEPTAPVFVIHRIDSFLAGEEHHVVFSAVGATAIFEFILADTISDPIVRHYDFGKPVINFTVCGEGTVWVLLDADFPESSSDADQCPPELVRMVQWSVDQFVDAGRSALLDNLNGACTLPVTAEDLKMLDLYADLSTLPKSVVDVEQGQRVERCKVAMNEPMQVEPAASDPASDAQPGLTKRALGRLKHKLALNQIQQQENMDAPGPDSKKVKIDLDEEA